MDKLLYVYLNGTNKCKGYIKTNKDISSGIVEVHTNCTCFLTGRTMELGYRIFVITPDLVRHEITLGRCEGTEKELRLAHNFEKMLLAGAFDWWRD